MMFITNKRVTLPTSDLLNNRKIEVVHEFKLLGVTIDSKLEFNKHVANTSGQISIKLYSVKNLFMLSTQVKLQFFKTFVIPYFDYYSTLFVYFPRPIIQKQTNCFYMRLNKLLSFCRSLF